MQNSTKSRIPEFDFIRVLAMFWVVTYHFGMEYRNPVSSTPLLNFFCVTPNFDFGNVAVTLFLMLSGALLYRKYKSDGIHNLRKFYVGRARTIYPAFWVVNLYVILAMARHWISDGSPFFAGHPLKLLLTITGLDGYLQMFGVRSYYFCGEWFIGAILLLYLLFPLLAFAYTKSRVLLLSFLAVAYGLQFLLPAGYEKVFSILPAVICLKFVMGFLLIESVDKLRLPQVRLFSLIVLLCICFISIPGSLKLDFWGSLSALLLLPLVLWLGGPAIRLAPVQKIVRFLAPISYCVFLIQHIAIVWLQMAFVKLLDRFGVALNAPVAFALFLVTFAMIVVVAWGLKFVADRLTDKVWPR